MPNIKRQQTKEADVEGSCTRSDQWFQIRIRLSKCVPEVADSVDWYKRAEHYNKLTSKEGQANLSMTEMSDLIVDCHDIHVGVTGSGKGVIVHSSEEEEKKPDEGIPVRASRPVHFPLIKKRKGIGDETNAVLTYLKENEAAKIATPAKRQKLLIQCMERSEQAFLTTV